MTHKYTCEKCGREKTCTIAGCQGDCVPACVKCLRRPQAVPPQQVMQMPTGLELDYFKVKSLHDRLDADLRAIGSIYIEGCCRPAAREGITVYAMALDELLMGFGSTNGEAIAALGALLCARLKASADILKKCVEPTGKTVIH